MICRKLIKFTAVAAVATAATGFFLFGDKAFSYLSTAAHSIRDGVNDQIPIEFELRRAASLIREIDPQIQAGKLQVAQAEVELENLEAEVARLERAVDQGEGKLRAVTAKCRASDGSKAATAQLASFRGRQRVEFDLERTFECFKNNKALLQGRRSLIGRQAKAVTAARMHLDAVRAEKARVEDMIATLKTQKQQLDALAATSRDIELDDTALGQAKQVLAEVKRRLDVQQRLIEDEIFFDGHGRDHDGDEQSDIVAEIDTYFRSGGDSTAMVTVEVR